jgi:hypothetical protein
MSSEPTHRPQPAWGTTALCLAAVTIVAMLADGPRAPVEEDSGVAPATAIGKEPAAALTPVSPPGMVHVTIPGGMLAITTPYTAANPLQLVASPQGDPAKVSVAFGSPTDIARAVKILDTRPGMLGFTPQVQADDPQHGDGTDKAVAAAAGLVGVEAVQVQGNGLKSTDVRATDAPPDNPGLAAPQTVASYAGGLGTGTAWLAGTFELTDGSSVKQNGTVTVTFTAF